MVSDKPFKEKRNSPSNDSFYTKFSPVKHLFADIILKLSRNDLVIKSKKDKRTEK